MLALLALLVGCGEDEILHGLEEPQANQVLVALGEGGIQATKQRDEGSEAGWLIRVSEPMATQARRILAERELPRSKPRGVAEVFGKSRLVPSSVEERALLHLALSGELASSLQSIDGVIDARVHLAIPAPDPLRPESPRPSRAAVLMKCRPETRAKLEALASGIGALVAGAVEGLDPSAVTVVIAESISSPAPPTPPTRPSARVLLIASTLTATVGGLLALLAWRKRRPSAAVRANESPP